VTNVKEYLNRFSNLPLKDEEVKMVLEGLVFDGKLELVKNPQKKFSIGGMGASSPDFEFYKPSGIRLPRNPLTTVPCGRCPVFELCGEGGKITPEKCLYLSKWLDL